MRYVVVPTRGRPGDLADCLDAVAPQVDVIIIVDNNDDPHSLPRVPDVAGQLICFDPEQPPNLSRLWNVGIDAAAEHASVAGYRKWNTAVLNDDVVVGPAWYRYVAGEMRRLGGCAASVNPVGGTESVVLREPGPTLPSRLTGYAYVLAGERDLRLDETLRWWYGDDDLDWRARLCGGTVLAPPVTGAEVNHRHPNGSTAGALRTQADLDRETFAVKWGRQPW